MGRIGGYGVEIAKQFYHGFLEIFGHECVAVMAHMVIL
jgi:hypothetical protein